MKVCLIFPRYTYQYFVYEPLGIFYLASVLRSNKINFEIIDGTGSSLSKTIRDIKKNKPDVIALSVQTLYADSAFQIAKAYKEFFSKGIVIIGGPHPTILPEETISNHFVDFVVTGEGEETLPELLKNLNSPQKVKGVFFKENGKIIRNQPRLPISNLDSIPFPTREFIDNRYYASGIFSLIASRGCLYNCSFCQPTLRFLFGNKIRMRSPENVIEEIRHTKKIFKKKGYALSRFTFVDDITPLNQKWLEDFCNLLIKNKIRIPWSINLRAEMLPDKDKLKLMKESMCNLLRIGVESGDDYIRNKLLGKNLSQKAIIKCFQKVSKAGIKTAAYLMVGSPGESLESIQATVKLLDKVQPNDGMVSFCTPLPKTYLYDYCLKKGILDVTSWSDYDYNRRPAIKLKDFSSQDILNIQVALNRSIEEVEFFRSNFGLKDNYQDVFIQRLNGRLKQSFSYAKEQ